MRERYLCLYGGAIGDGLLGIHVGRMLATNVPGARLKLVSARRNPFMAELARELPFIEYRELPKEDLRSWFALPWFLSAPYRSVVYEPASSKLPLWWRIILWCVRQRRGSVQARCQMHGHERPVPVDTMRLPYVCQTENFFDTPVRVLAAWGCPTAETPRPSLPLRLKPAATPYLVFHFFAASYRRSIPVDHARAILERAREQFPEHEFVLTCLAEESERAERMREGITDTRIVTSPGAVEMLELLSSAELVVGTASGIIFVAVQLGVPTIALSCRVHACWLPTYAPNATILAAYDECRCNGDGTGDCMVVTTEGPVFRCLYFISAEEVLAAMNIKLTS